MPWTPGPVLSRITLAVNLAFKPEPAPRKILVAVNLATLFSPLLFQRDRGTQEQRPHQERKQRQEAEAAFRVASTGQPLTYRGASLRSLGDAAK